MANVFSDLPSDLLQAVGDRSGRIGLVVGAGCSLEAPTLLELSSTYAHKIHEELLIDGVLMAGECSDPLDLSAVTTSVWEKEGSQEAVVTRLPRIKFRNARANSGYLDAAALLREGALAVVMSLNFDLAMSHALSELSADEVAQIDGPFATRDLGSCVLIYLHRNVNAQNCDDWILRAEALNEAWKGDWQEALAIRVATTPVLVFAGLGSPAAVLTESVHWIRERIGEESHHAYVVEPMATTEFKEALKIPDEAHIRLRWCEFMQRLASRLAEELRLELVDSCNELCNANRWPSELEFIESLCSAFFQIGLVLSGQIRARWLLRQENYAPDEPLGRSLLAYLLLGIGIAQRELDCSLSFRRDGVVEFRRDGRVCGSCLPVSGQGTRNWSAIEPTVVDTINGMQGVDIPASVLIGGMVGLMPDEVTLPVDVAIEPVAGDIVEGFGAPTYISVDEIRSGPEAARKMVLE